MNSEKAKELPFQFCPHCGGRNLEIMLPQKLICKECGFTYYQNNAAAVAVILKKGDQIMLVQRNKEPGLGLLDLPGGFVDAGEDALTAASRELKEELGIEISDFTFLTSKPNLYPYKGVLYHTCDLFFIADLTEVTIKMDPVELAGWKFITKEEFDPNQIAFSSIREALKLYFYG